MVGAVQPFGVSKENEVDQRDANCFVELIVVVASVQLTTEEGRRVVKGAFQIGFPLVQAQLNFDIVVLASLIDGSDIQDDAFVLEILLVEGGIHDGQCRDLVLSTVAQEGIE